jgi:hypothetical protein
VYAGAGRCCSSWRPLGLLIGHTTPESSTREPAQVEPASIPDPPTAEAKEARGAARQLQMMVWDGFNLLALAPRSSTPNLSLRTNGRMSTTWLELSHSG